MGNVSDRKPSVTHQDFDWEDASDGDVQSFLRDYLDEEDLYDMDEGLADGISNLYRAGGINFVPPGESVSRLSEPLTKEQKENFGDIALQSVTRTDLVT